MCLLMGHISFSHVSCIPVWDWGVISHEDIESLLSLNPDWLNKREGGSKTSE